MAAGNRSTSRWLVYALGGGSGHLARSLALGRAAALRGHEVRILTNSPLASRFHPELFPADLPEAVTVTRMPATGDAAAVRDFSRQALGRSDFDLLVVDTFPRGLAGELPELLSGLGVPRVLVHRDLNPDYVARLKIRPWVAETFELVLLPGECGPLGDLPGAVRTAPWLLLDASELPAVAVARQWLALEADCPGPVLLVSGAGKPAEWEQAARLARWLRQLGGNSLQVRFACLEPGAGQHQEWPPVRIWPLLAVLPAVDLLVGGGGYNTVHEARAAGVPLAAMPQPRRYDRQAARLRPDERTAPDQLPQRVRQLLSAAPRPKAPPSYENGVHAAVAQIERLESRGR